MTEARVTRTSIINMHARQIFDSCGVPTIEVDLQTELGLFRASVPCGPQPQNSKFEAKELRDGYESYGGLSVEKAIKNIHDFLVPGLKGLDPSHQQQIDVKMTQDLDGSQSDELVTKCWRKRNPQFRSLFVALPQPWHTNMATRCKLSV